MNPQDHIVFIVDDDRRIRESISELHSSCDMHAVTFGSAAEYLACPKPDVPACLVTGRGTSGHQWTGSPKPDHSWGGVVITEAGTDPKVAGLVYVAAFGPDQGEVVGDLGKPYPPPPAFAAPIVDQQGS